MARLNGAGGQALAVRLAARDNVATLLTAVAAGAAVAVRDAASGTVLGDGARSVSDLPRGHKIALKAIAAGQPVVKYGLAIGRARVDIGAGDHVHVHNVESGLTAAPADHEAGRDRPLPVDKLGHAIVAILVAAGAAPAAARHMADALIEAHLRGVETHGVRRLAPYVARIAAGGVDARADPHLDRRGSLLLVDGRAGIGHHVAAVTADALVAVARETGVGCALIRNSSHFGFAGYYATRMAMAGTASVVVSNGQVLVGPEGAARALFSNNPVAVAAPLPDGTCFELDMATSVTSRARIVAAAERGERIPSGLAADADGHPTTDAAAAAAGILLPFGGAKGFAMLAALELLTGVLSGDVYADMVASKEDDAGAAEGTAHFMLAIELDSAGGDAVIRARAADLVRRIHELPMVDGHPSPRYPGERRWRLRGERLSAGVVPLTAAEEDGLVALAGRFGVSVTW
jgi:LDH2 family malate/lactate/ureidoglycolate dehydrogenase